MLVGETCAHAFKGHVMVYYDQNIQIYSVEIFSRLAAACKMSKPRGFSVWEWNRTHIPLFYRAANGR